MSEHPNPLADERLRHFLRQYRPLPPPAASGQRWQVQVVAQETEALESFLVSTWGSLLSPEGTETETWWIERDPEGS
jgi:hypothetical protein